MKYRSCDGIVQTQTMRCATCVCEIPCSLVFTGAKYAMKSNKDLVQITTADLLFQSKQEMC